MDRREFTTAAKALGFAEAEAGVMFDRMDLDASETLEFEELDRLYRSEVSRTLLEEASSEEVAGLTGLVNQVQAVEEDASLLQMVGSPYEV